jgi:hypothetical protein
VLLKGRLGSDGVALLAAFKSWFQPSLALAGCCEYSFAHRALRYGVCVQASGGVARGGGGVVAVAFPLGRPGGAFPQIT